jgi:hypothetical protein
MIASQILRLDKALPYPNQPILLDDTDDPLVCAVSKPRVLPISQSIKKRPRMEAFR